MWFGVADGGSAQVAVPPLIGVPPVGGALLLGLLPPQPAATTASAAAPAPTASTLLRNPDLPSCAGKSFPIAAAPSEAEGARRDALAAAVAGSCPPATHLPGRFEPAEPLRPGMPPTALSFRRFSPECYLPALARQTLPRLPAWAVSPLCTGECDRTAPALLETSGRDGGSPGRAQSCTPARAAYYVTAL